MVDSGNIIVDNQDVTKLPTHKRAGRVARVFQDPLAGTCEGLTIEENLALAIKRGQRRGLSAAVKARYMDQFKSSLASLNLGLENRLGDKMGLLSGGQRQAVSLLMASLTPSAILLLDEHTAALDPKTASFVLDLTTQIIEEQKLTALMVTHSMKQALEVGDRTVMLHQGQVVFDIAGQDREGLEVKDLLELFEKQRGLEVDDDSLLLG
jgi:putative ABC transport system ATP-binding protein